MESIYNWCQVCEEQINQEEVKAFWLILSWLDPVDLVTLMTEVKKHRTTDHGKLLLCKGCFYDICSLIAQREKVL